MEEQIRNLENFVSTSSSKYISLFISKHRKRRQVVYNLWKNSRKLFNKVNVEVKLLFELLGKMADVTDLYQIYCTMWRNRNIDGVDENVTEILAEINDKVQLEVVQVIMNFSVRVAESKSKGTNFTIRTVEHYQSVIDYINKCVRAKTLKKVDRIRIPNLDWLHEIEESGIEKLVQEWEDAGVMKIMNEYIALLRTLVPACPAA